MTTRAHVLAIVATFVAIAFILRLVRLRQLRSKYALLWLVTALVLLPLGIAPQLLEPIATWVGVDYAPAAFLVLGLGYLFLVVVHFSWELSRLETRVRLLAEELALLQHWVDEREAEHPGADAHL
jgi:hypothetical protein